MDFFVRCKCKFRRFTGGKSRNLHAADGGKGIARRAAELCGGAYTFRKPGCQPITIPKHEPIKKVYVEMVRNIVESEANRHENA